MHLIVNCRHDRENQNILVNEYQTGNREGSSAEGVSFVTCVTVCACKQDRETTGTLV